MAVMAEAFAALRSMGFRETETRQMLERVQRDVPDEALTPEVVRLALRRTRVQCGMVREAVVSTCARPDRHAVRPPVRAEPDREGPRRDRAR
ncbi:MAG: RuvA C-terminal domain-containing protein [Sandaracinaceae bacterium]